MDTLTTSAFYGLRTNVYVQRSRREYFLIFQFFFNSEVGGRTLVRLVRDTTGENETTFLNENVPNWVTDVVIEKTMPKFIKIPFYLLPHPQMVNGQKDRMKKVIFSVYIITHIVSMKSFVNIAGSTGCERIYSMQKGL